MRIEISESDLHHLKNMAERLIESDIRENQTPTPMPVTAKEWSIFLVNMTSKCIMWDLEARG